MFKDMKVGKKILMGFGIVLALMVGLVLVVLFTNISTINNITDSSHVSDTQTIANSMLDTYNDARIGANIIYVVINDQEYNRVVEDNKIVKDYLEQLKKLSSEYAILKDYQNQINEVGTSIETWYSGVVDLQNANVQMAQIKENLKAAGANLVANADNAYETISAKLTTDSRSGADFAAINNNITMLKLTKDILAGVYESRRNVAVITETYNMDLVGTLPDTMENTKANYTTLIGYLSGDNKTKMQSAFEEYTAFSDYVYDFIDTCNASNTSIEKAKAQGVATTGLVLKLGSDLDKVMADNFKTTSSSATLALIIIAIVAVIAIIVGISMALIIMRSITAPLAKMFKISNIVATSGRMKFSEQEVAETKSAVSGDEIGQTVLSFVTMMDRFVIIASELERLAKGDLTIEVNPVSPEDTMGHALKDTIDNLNEMFGSINSATEQVASGSKQIADGAQTLATGSTQQASSIEELSSAIYEIAQATKENANKAGKAANLSEAVKSNAQKGEIEMNNMMDAVKEINESSQNISKVIKVIDDIAFQTNILALNAAVEAARAGAAGKGFAVVADEVRNLASKSAEAAKNTSAMISSSIEKAELGTKIANDTSQSLSLIVSGILESTEIINDIAVSSEEQSMKIDQINIGIGQVSEVVQQNSATAEESAAASEEMNGQTVVLEGLVSQFKLK